MKLLDWKAIALLAGVLLSGCAAPLPGYYDTLDYRTQADVSTAAGPGTSIAFYATNRQKTDGNGAEAYSAARSSALHYGTCRVTVPRVHNIGSDVVTEQLSRAVKRPEPQPLVVSATDPSANAAEFFAAFKDALKQTPRKDVVILVHGYNNSFGGPVARAAGLVYDLGEKIVPVAYCWTSQATVQGYFEDENGIDLASRELAVFLGQLLDNAPTDVRLHLIAHSMGSRVATSALARLKSARTFAKKPFVNIVFAAPDIDAAEFAARMADDGLIGLAARTTLYAGYNDRALELSERIHGRTYPRAGRAGESILVAPGIDTVDISLNDASLVGHSYYGDNRAVIQDLFLLLVHDAPPERRNLFHAANKQGLRYWLIRP